MSRTNVLPVTWKQCESFFDPYLFSGDFIALPAGGGAQLQRNPDKTITLMFHRRPCITFSQEGATLFHGPIHTTPLKGVLEYTNRVALRSYTSQQIGVKISRYGTAPPWSAVLVRIPSEDPGKPEGDAYRLDTRNNVLVFPDGRVHGTMWRPFGCSGKDECPCSYCVAVRSRRLDAIAKAIAGAFGGEGEEQ